MQSYFKFLFILSMFNFILIVSTTQQNTKKNINNQKTVSNKIIVSTGRKQNGVNVTKVNKKNGFKKNGFNQKKINNKTKNYTVRVLLDEHENANDAPLQWSIESSDGVRVSTFNASSQIFSCVARKLQIKTKAKYPCLNGKIFYERKIKISPRSGFLSFKGNSYQGDFVLIRREKSIFLVNHVNIDDYVFAVLRSESWPGWPLEVNKVLAVAIRSYAFYKIKEAKRFKLEYHIKKTSIHQTYNGHEFMKRDSKKLRNAVSQTRGVYLSYNNEPILAMFDACCGGVTPVLINGGKDFKKTPYLARNYSCHYCKTCSLYNWKATYEKADLENMLNKKFPKIKKIRSICVTEKDEAGLVKKITIKGFKDSWTLPAEKFYSLLRGSAISLFFSIKRMGEKFIFEGHGHGHLKGLCQWGARQMVRESYNYKEILQFYYPGTIFMKLV